MKKVSPSPGRESRSRISLGLPASPASGMELLRPNATRSFCEYKGEARYWDLHAGARTSLAAAWSYPSSSQVYSVLRDHLAFYPHCVDGCFVDGERVHAQEGDFYGGWITSNLTGPFKGGPGSRGW